MSTAPLRLSHQAQRTPDSPISFFIQKAIETPGLISLAAGLVDETSFPNEDIAASVVKIMGDPKSAQAALQYGSTQGLPSLCQQLLHRVCTADGVAPDQLNLNANDVVITTGSQQLLYILGEVLFDVGDIVICEAPSYFVYHGVLQSQGVKVITVPMDDDGMDLDALETILTQLEQTGDLAKLKLIYTVNYFQNPTGLTLSAERRPKLLKLAQQFSSEHRILILEDAAYRELRYEGEDLPSIKKYDLQNEYVIYTSTFSKPCAPGLKTGYAIMPQELVQAVCHIKGNHDFGSNNFSQHILDDLLKSGAFDQHVQKLQHVYRQKCRVMLEVIEEEFADWPEVQYTHPQGGLYVWMTLPDHIPTGPAGPLVERALREGVLYVPGEFGHMPDGQGEMPRNEIRLSFGVATEEQIREGIRRFRRACRGLEIPQDQRARKVQMA